MSKALTALTVFLAVTVANKSVYSGVIFFSPNSASATNSDGAGLGPDNLVDQSGITGPVTLANIGTVFHSDGGGTNLWRGSASAMPITLTFDFTTGQTIDHVGLWQAVSLREGTRDFNLTFFDGAGGTGSQIGSVYNDVLDTGAGGNGSIPLNGRAFDVGLRTGVRSIEMQITSIAHEVNPFVHLGEFMAADSTAAAVPEPATFALLGIGAIGRIGFRRQKRKRVA